MSKNLSKTELIHCNTCRAETKHRVIVSHRNKKFDEDIEENGEIMANIYGHHDWEMLECQGCETVCLRDREFFSEWADPWEKDPTKKTFFPPRNVASRVRPHWHEKLSKIRKLKGHFILIAYDQIYELLTAQNYLAAMLTSRALLETIAIENCGGDNGHFIDKLCALKDRGFIREKQVKHLNEAIYDAGSAVMHRKYNPSEKAVSYVLDAIEHLLHAIYIEPLVEVELKAEKPARKIKKGGDRGRI